MGSGAFCNAGHAWFNTAAMREPFEVRVECYSGYKADERPIRFYLGSRRVEVVQVEDRWYSPGCTWFRVRAEDGAVYILRHREGGQEDQWTLESFRRGEGG
jgi:hypothetical protein